MARNSEAAFLNQVLKGHRDAIALCQSVARVSQIVDDLVDRDRDVSDATITAAFWEALFTIPANPFYQRHFGVLNPALQSAYIDWMDATKLEREGDDHSLSVAFALRSTLATFVIQCARLVGGYGWMQQVSVPIRRHVHEDSLEQYKQEFE